MDAVQRVKGQKKSSGREKIGGKTASQSSKKRRVVDENSSSSDMIESKNSDTNYNFSGQKSFKSIFSSVQSTLHGPADLCTDDLMYKYKDDPIMKNFLKDSPLKKSSTPTKLQYDDFTMGLGLGSLPSTSKKVLPGKSTAGSSTAKTSSYSSGLDVQVTPSQLAVADLDTDTELDVDEIQIVTSVKPQAKGRKGVRGGTRKNTRAGSKAKKTSPEIEIPSDDDPEVLEAEFMKFMTSGNKRNEIKPPVKRDLNPIRTVDISPLTYVQDSPLPDVSFDGNMRIRIKFQEKLHRFDGNERWDVGLVRRKLSELTDVPESALVIYNEEEMKMVDGKSLRDYNVGEGDILEARQQKIEKSAHVSAAEGGITIKFQKIGLKRPIFLSVSKFKSMGDIRAILAVELSMDERTLELHFDGEKINLSSTPEDLDMEDEDCIDIHDAKT